MMFLQLNLTRVTFVLFVSRLLDYDVLKNEKWEKITMRRLKGDWARNDNWVARLSPLGFFFYLQTIGTRRQGTGGCYALYGRLGTDGQWLFCTCQSSGAGWANEFPTSIDWNSIAFDEECSITVGLIYRNWLKEAIKLNYLKFNFFFEILK